MEKKEIELKFSDLLAMLLKKSKLILAIAIILALLAGGYGAYRLKQSHVAVSIDTVAETETLVLETEERLEREEKLVRQHKEYVQNSLYHALDPFQCGISTVTFYAGASERVGNHSVDPESGVMTAYAKIDPFDSDTIRQVKEMMQAETEDKYIKELISVSDISDRFVEIRVLHDDPQVAESVAQFLFETMQERLSGTLPEHVIKVVGSYTGYETIPELLENRNLARETLQNTESALKDTQKELDALRITLRDQRSRVGGGKIGKRNLLKSMIKFGLIGGVVGGILGCFGVFLSGVLGGKIQNQSDVLARYSFPLIGILPRTKKVWFDAWIRRLEGEPTGDFDATAQATVQSMIEKIDNRSVCLISTVAPSAMEKLIAHADGKVGLGGNILQNAEAVKALSACEGVVLVEQRGKSRIDLIDAEVQRAKTLGKEIVGLILC